MAAPQARGRNGQRGGGYTYQPRSEKQNKARADQTGQRFDSIFKSGFDVYKPKVGDNAIRILPPTWENFEHYGFDVWLHSYVGVDRGSYLCLKKMLGKPCPICAAVTEAKEAGETEDAKKMDAGRRVAVWLLDRNDDDDLTPKLYAMPWGTDKEIMNQAADSRSGKTLMIDHPDDGYDIMFKRTGEGVKTKYIAFKIDRDATPISDDQKAQDQVMDFIQETPIPETLNYFPPEYLARIMEGTVEEKDDDLDEVDPETGEVTRRSSAKPARGRGAPADEHEERTPPARRSRRAEPEPEEVEDDSPPPRRGARRAEPEPEPEETEDDPPPPRRGSRRAEPANESEQEEMEAQQARRPRRGSAEPEETEDDPPPRRSARRAEPDPEDDPPPPRRSARRAEPEPEETEDEPQPPRRGSRRVEPEPEESEDDPPPPRRTRR